MKHLLAILFTTLLISCSSESEKIGIQPYGDVSSTVLDSMSVILSKAYEAKAFILKPKSLPKGSFVNIKSPRYRADSLLIDLLKGKPDSIDYVIGVTAKDISTSKRNADGEIKEPLSKYTDWGIFGLGYRPGHSCVISTFRLKHASEKKFYDRIQKVSVHEIGHNMGLKHCPSENCVMQDAVETIATVDNAGKYLCKKCMNKI
jgi:archaemetzincin